MTRALIQLSPRGKVIYQLLTLTTLLLPIYTLAALIEALYQLPAFPLADLLPAVDNRCRHCPTLQARRPHRFRQRRPSNGGRGFDHAQRPLLTPHLARAGFGNAPACAF